MRWVHKRTLATTFAILASTVSCITVNGQVASVYWVGGLTVGGVEGNAIFRYSSNSGLVDVVVQGSEMVPSGVAVDVAGSTLYWLDSGEANQGYLWKAELDGSAPERVFQDLVCGTSGMTDLELDLLERFVYFSQDGDCPGTDLMRGSLDGAVLDRDLFPTPGIIEYPRFIALDVDARHVYWTGTAATPRGIRRARFDGTDVTTVVVDDAVGLAIDNTRQMLYWTSTGGRIFKSNLDGTDPHLVLSTDGDPTDLAVDPYGEKVYWTELGRGRIRRADLDGGQIEDVVVGLSRPNRMALSLEAGSSIGTETVPERAAWLASYPNPFDRASTIEFTLSRREPVEIVLYDPMGREAAVLTSRVYAAGRHELAWASGAVARGLYYLRVTTPSRSDVIPVLKR